METTPYSPIYFKDYEFKQAIPACSLNQMEPSFMLMLDQLRRCCNFPIRINSAFRTLDYEKKQGRSGRSYHCLGIAVDIHCIDSVKRGTIIYHAMNIGFKGIGVASSFIHLDARQGDTVVWTY